MKKILYILLFTLFGCKDNYPQEKVGLYAVDMLYACECQQYKIFKIDNLSIKRNHLKDREPLDLDGKDSDLSQELSYAINKSEDDNLIGRDIDLIFANKTDEEKFKKQQGLNSICYIYYFEGYFKSKQLFLVENYHLSLKSSDCISHELDDMIQ